MPLILPRRSLLSYPAGTAPGFDPSHPAAALGPYLPVSVVCLNNGQLFDVVHGESATTVTAVAWSQTIDSIGPVLSNFITGGVAKRPLSGAWDESRNVIAAIVRLPTAAAGATSQAIISTYDDAGGGYALTIQTSTSSLSYFDAFGTQNLFFDYLANSVAGHAAFIAISSNGSTSFNWLVKSLTSGKVFYGTGAYTTAGVTPSFVGFGNRNNLARPYAGSIAAGMFVGSARQLSIPQLLQWALDPWAFWYPPAPPAQRKVSYSYSFAPTTTTTGGARVLQRFNRSKLAYPAGVRPGIDPNHIAAQNCVFSGIATNGGSFCNVLSQAKPTENGTKTTSLNGGLGPVTNYVNNGAATDSSVFSAVTSATSVTLAVIFKMTAIPPATGYLINTAQAGGNGIGDNGGTGIFSIIGGSVATNTGITYVLGAPYFFVASWSGASMSWVVTRLDTGQVVSGTAADTIVAPDGTISVGNRGTAARNANGGIAAAMATNAFMGEQQLRAWAADPWSFWYPNKPLNLTSTAATASTATGGARVSQRFNRSKLAYPAGVLPGFDPGHVAAQNLVFSCAPTGPAGLINLPTGKALTSLGGSVNPTYGVDGAIGPSLTMPASSKGLGATVSLTTRGWTMATIFDYTTVTGASQVLISTNSTTSPSMWLTPGGLLNYAGSTSIFSYNFILGHSYFVVTSRPFNSVDSNLYILVKDLTTGQTYQGIFTTGVDIPQAVTSYTIAAGDSGSFNLGCPIAAAMAANQYMNAPQLLAWSKDPWAFWYPNKTINLTSDAAAVVTPPSGTFNYTNFLLMGVG